MNKMLQKTKLQTIAKNAFAKDRFTNWGWKQSNNCIFRKAIPTCWDF